MASDTNLASDTLQEPARRGRPPLHDTAELQRRALVVIARDGYAEVTMGRLATEMGVSLRTLHRHFPTKSDLVWGALDDTFARLSANLAAASHHPSVMAAIGAAIVASFADGASEAVAGRERMRLIATTPALQAARSDAFRHWQDNLVDFAAARLGLRPDDLVPVTIAAAAQSATMAALAWWATHEDSGRPADVVGRALHALDAGGRDTA